MCGIAGLFGHGWQPDQLQSMIEQQRHRGPDGHGTFFDCANQAALGHNRLSIIDLSQAGAQPMTSTDGRLVISFNGEIYNYLELRAELSGSYSFRTRSDTEVILAAYERWGEACLDHFIGMFAMMIWDTSEQRLFAARDRFGVKPLYYHLRADGALAIASEIRAFRAVGVATQPDPVSWATYLTSGVHEHSSRTFWLDVHALPPGHKLTWQQGRTTISSWYDLAAAAGDGFDERPDAEVESEYLACSRRPYDSAFGPTCQWESTSVEVLTPRSYSASSTASNASTVTSPFSLSSRTMLGTTSSPGCGRCSNVQDIRLSPANRPADRVPELAKSVQA